MQCFECSFLFAFDIFLQMLYSVLVIEPSHGTLTISKRHHFFLRLFTYLADIVTLSVFSDVADFVKKNGKVCPYNSVGTLTYLGY